MPKRILTAEQKARVRERYLLNLEDRKAKAKAYYLANREEVLRKAAEYGASDRVKARRRERYAANPAPRISDEKARYAALTPEQKKLRREQAAEWSQRNAEKERARKRAWRDANKEKARQSVRDHYARNPDKLEAHKRKTLQRAPARARLRYATDIQFRIGRLLRSRIRYTMKLLKAKKAAPTLELAGATLEQIKLHLESLFRPGMAWENHGYGEGKWNVDHIRPVASFDLHDPAQQRACFHISNLQPLWHEENAAKGDTY